MIRSVYKTMSFNRRSLLEARKRHPKERFTAVLEDVIRQRAQAVANTPAEFDPQTVRNRRRRGKPPAIKVPA